MSVSDGWQCFCETTGDTIGKYEFTFTVPAAPTTNHGQTIFYFGYTQDHASPHETMLFQPLLQWGASDSGGGAYWSIAAWYVYGGVFYHSTNTTSGQVSAGDTLLGWIDIHYDIKGGTLLDLYATIHIQNGTSLIKSITTPAFTPDQVGYQITAGFTQEALGLTATSDLSADTVTATAYSFGGVTTWLLNSDQTGTITTSWADDPIAAKSGCHASHDNNNNPGAHLVMHPPA